MFSDLLSHIHTVAASVLGRGVGFGGPIQQGPERSVFLVPGNKGKSGWFPVWKKGIHHPSHEPVVPSGLIPNSEVQMSFKFFFAVTHLGLTLCNPIAWSTPGLPVPHHLRKFVQVQVHCISDAFQPSHPLMPSSSSALNLSQYQGLFHRDSHLHQMTKLL